MHFLRCKLRTPVGTAALFILPVWVGEHYLDLVYALPRTFRVVRRWAEGSRLFTSPDGRMAERKDCGPTRWEVIAVRVDAGPLGEDVSSVMADYQRILDG